MDRHHRHMACSIPAALAVAFILLELAACDGGGGNGGASSTFTPTLTATKTPTLTFTAMPTPTPTGTPAVTPTHTPAPLRPPGGDNDWAENLASDGASNGLEALLVAAPIPVPDFLVEDLVGLVMGKIFGGGPDPQQQILDSLNTINATLQTIETELAGIAGQLTKLEGALQVDTDELDKEIRTAEMDPYVNQIDTLWTVYRGLYNPATKKWDTNPADLQNLASDILDLGHGVYPQLVGIHNLLTGEGNVSGSTMDAMMNYATALVIVSNKDPFASYMMIENYFGSILQAQTHGATLMVEALKYREANPQLAAPEAYPEGAEYFMSWYAVHVQDQVETFLQKTEQFVTKTAYPQQGFEAFVPEADKIFYRADLVAAWLSPWHRLDPIKPPNGQQFMVYRVIGGPDRVNQYGSGFTTGNNKFTSILYAPNGTDQYGLPDYQTASYHGYSDLRPGTSPYVQFMHPLDNNGGAKQKGAISDATGIWTGKYVVEADSSDNHWFPQPYYLNDIPGHTIYEVHYQSVNSAGGAPATGDDQILFGYVFEMQQPPAMLMGDWSVGMSHDSQSGLDFLGHEYDGSSTPGSQYVHLFVNAWPTVTHDQYWYYPRGSFQQEYAMVGHYYWGGSTCCPVLGTDYTASMAWNVQNNGSPADLESGTLLWVQRGDQANSYGDYDYHYVGSGTDAGIQGGVRVNMVPGEAFDVSLGAHMYGDWDSHNVGSNDDWHHWYANYTITLKELHFELPQ